jgi:hypothetical protein
MPFAVARLQAAAIAAADVRFAEAMAAVAKLLL